jgi:hypothetical protein
MFTLSEKIRVLNTPGHVRVYDTSNAERATSAAIADGDRLFIEGYGHFMIDDIVNIKLRRAVAPVLYSSDYTVVAPSGIAVGDAVEVAISLDTTRYQGEVLAQNHLGNGRTMRFSTAPLTGITAANIRDAIVAGWAAHLALYPNWSPFIGVANGVAAADIEVSAATGYESISIDRVEIRRTNQGIGTQTYVTLVENVVNAVGNEGKGQGKFLEESVRMATANNNDPYGVDNTDTQVDLRGEYTEVSFDYKATFTENLGTVAADYGHTGIGGPAMGGVDSVHSFTLYLNESTCLAANSAIAKLAAIAILRAAALSYLTATVTAAPLTLAVEKTEVLIIADESSVATVAAFIA